MEEANRRFVTRKKSAVMAIIGVVLLVSLYFSGAFAVQYFNENDTLSDKRIQELRRTYPVNNGFGPLILVSTKPFHEIMELAPAFVLGEVVGQLDDATTSFTAQLGTPEYAVQQKSSNDGVVRPTTQTFSQYKIKVLEHIAGESIEDTFVLRITPYNYDYFPSMKPGMKYIFPLARGEGNHKGTYFTTKSGMFYMVDEKYVLPVMDKDPSYLTYQGKSIDTIIDAIREIKAKQGKSGD
ncbi:hypothetical protein [Paenibacillus sp. 1001270B_150601_E10]|uniref:hypothetical protein n=1 Tax=Paenibacillus sp. 1001270B_150601_E10 TaxID=2787079 RepID=UPI0018A0E39D|nr:hypothetical protein [Paenibacillus sp. 1001270B_150601_E10]